MTPFIEKSRAAAATAVIAVAGFVSLALFSSSPSRGQDTGMWCGAAWACELATPNNNYTPHYVDKWAAIAISDSTRRAGASHGQDSQDAAELLALTNCRRNGSTDYKSLAWGRNTCLAIAISYPDGAYGYGNDTDRSQAGISALAQCESRGGKGCAVQTAPCAGDDSRWPPPLPLPPGGQGAVLDQDTIGTWEIPVNPGRWVWEIGPRGTYEFHSEAPDGAAPHAGKFSASGGVWSLQATNGYTDGGTYVFQPPDTLVATGRLGTAAWHRLANTPD